MPVNVEKLNSANLTFITLKKFKRVICYKNGIQLAGFSRYKKIKVVVFKG